MSKPHRLVGGLIILYFIIALEGLIMISPFAAFFYAVFNPVLLFFAQWPTTRWLAAFFLPHMVEPVRRPVSRLHAPDRYGLPTQLGAHRGAPASA